MRAALLFFLFYLFNIITIAPPMQSRLDRIRQPIRHAVSVGYSINWIIKICI